MSRDFVNLPTRRALLRNTFLTGAAVLTGVDKLFSKRQAETQSANGVAGGKFLGLVPFTGESHVPFAQPFGDELDGRQYTDLSVLSAERPFTPTEEFYIRTRVSKLLDHAKPWSVRVGGDLLQPCELSVEELRRSAKPMGRHLMECAGNVRSVHFGMMSVADWGGVPVLEILERAKRKSRISRLVISGFDTYSVPSASSVPGASWNFSEDDLKSSHAFLATDMNGAPLTNDHGAPVRLLLPGWYGCACIKWVNEITFAPETAEATSQMQEYAARTMQNGVPKLARDFQPAVIEQAAVPVRVEKWAVGGGVQYRVVGILWGGFVPIRRLQIRFNPQEEYVDVAEWSHKVNDPWSLWSHIWEPQRPGTYLIRLSVAEPRIVARRLDAGFYVRALEITET